MENPLHWTPAERVVHQALLDHELAMSNGVCGWSSVMTVTNALRQAGLLVDGPSRDLYIDELKDQIHYLITTFAGGYAPDGCFVLPNGDCIGQDCVHTRASEEGFHA